MKSLQASDITGTYATLLLPINADDGIDLARLDVQLDYLIHSGVDGIYAHGTAGEFYSLTELEFTALNELLALKCEAAGMPFQIGACFPTPQLSLDRARRAAQLSPGAIQVILPDWYPLTLQESIAYLERIAEAIAPVPLVLYNPPHAKRVLEPEDYLVLCRQTPLWWGSKWAVVMTGGMNACARWRAGYRSSFPDMHSRQATPGERQEVIPMLRVCSRRVPSDGTGLCKRTCPRRWQSKRRYRNL